MLKGAPVGVFGTFYICWSNEVDLSSVPFWRATFEACVDLVLGSSSESTVRAVGAMFASRHPLPGKAHSAASDKTIGCVTAETYQKDRRGQRPIYQSGVGCLVCIEVG